MKNVFFRFLETFVEIGPNDIVTKEIEKKSKKIWFALTPGEYGKESSNIMAVCFWRAEFLKRNCNKLERKNCWFLLLKKANNYWALGKTQIHQKLCQGGSTLTISLYCPSLLLWILAFFCYTRLEANLEAEKYCQTCRSGTDHHLLSHVSSWNIFVN